MHFKKYLRLSDYGMEMLEIQDYRAYNICICGNSNGDSPAGRKAEITKGAIYHGINRAAGDRGYENS